ncbi:bifunctional phosphoribosyl-AMP cyclohydrolase/phosphoribosyl-ATP diphosphatase HisIE [Haloflavibacter putidus]|uniref:Histidine biosynthesis bifunctional protein HisIE n=1 Tax=Haloflavibacter putidus TaxID=2576776 RepID=A0A507ZR12_9FLAO|nr:bifunctional phosphoribosyl-AMP cyclohydrolase/phosphoribosyl-ATP diphosphatase HisIE [Haloflavibacter putidus]TQD39051.1 bifunctional phosphoribosyl-AMP cyclohydrolase/phosphoribosyl-ATP diphosphatase HisIE [Haloflavibacter putidus]
MKIDFNKNNDGLVPAIIQDAETQKVLMLGYMNKEAFAETKRRKKLVFYSRSKKRLWMKGEESGNTLELQSVKVDCDADTLLFQVKPNGPVCHKNTDTCWSEENKQALGFVGALEETIQQRKNTLPKDSYVASLFKSGINAVAQKVGEEAVEMIIEAKDDKQELFLNESADLFFHYLLLLHAKGNNFNDVLEILQERHKS